MSESELTLHPPVALPPSWTLVFPSVTIGNTPQLALDLILTTLPVTHLAHLRAPSVLPFASPVPSIPPHHTTLLTALELYRLDNTDIILLQQRAPTASGRADEFAHQLVEWAVAQGCDRFVMLCSSNAAGLRGLKENTESKPPARPWARGFRHVASTNGVNGSFIGRMREMGISVMETVTSDQRGWEAQIVDNVARDLGKAECRIPAFVPTARMSSFVRGMLETCEKRTVDIGGVVQFVHEGDNGGDARVLASVVVVALGIAEEAVEDAAAKWVVPMAWSDHAGIPAGLY